MPKSMTGYGKGHATWENCSISVEMKSVNHRYNDITIKMPKIINLFEEQIRSVLCEHVFRGKTDVYIHYESLAQDNIRMVINDSLANAYVEALKTLQKKYGLAGDIGLELVAKCPELLQWEKNEQTNEQTNEASQQTWQCLQVALQEALLQFVAMREREGAALKANIFERAQYLSKLLSELQIRAPIAMSEWNNRLKRKVHELLADTAIDEGRLLMEMTLLADKYCVEEETTRLESHLKQLETILQEEGPIGRKLDFLVQEMNREANTMGAKSNDLQMTRLCMEMKSEIEKIREQVQNIE